MTPAPSFLSAIKPVDHLVNGETHYFYPLSVGELFQIKDLLKPIARSLSVLLSNTDKDRGSFSHSEFEPGDTNAKVFERSETPVSVDVARFRSEERTSAASALIDAVTNKTNGKAVARVLMDSLRDQYPDRPIKDADAEAFFAQLDIVTLRQLLAGVAKANKDVLGPFQGRVEEVFRSAQTNGSVPEATPKAMVG